MSHASWGRCTARAVAALAIALTLAGCGGAAPTEEQQASLAAKACYEEFYVNRRPEAFLSQRIDFQQMPPGFRSQLLLAYGQHLAAVSRQRGGVDSVRVERAQRDTTLHLMQVFLSLAYADGSREEVVVPMVQADDGAWKMR